MKRSFDLMKNPPRRLKILTILIICLCVTLLSAAFLVFCGISLWRRNPDRVFDAPLIGKILLGVCAFAVVAAYYLFLHFIYRPIRSIENLSKRVLEGELEALVSMGEDHELAAAVDGLNEIVFRIRDLMNREYAAKILVKRAELNALQSQINPHFLYNTLDSIRGLAIADGAVRIAQMTKALSFLFRYSIDNDKSLVSLSEEMKNVDNYLLIQQCRFNDKFEIQKDIDLDDDAILRCKLPKLCVQPVIENAIYHGLEMKLGKGIIKISARRSSRWLFVVVEDNGLGMDDESVQSLQKKLANQFQQPAGERVKMEKTSVGLMNVNERIKLAFGDEFGINLYSTLGVGTIIEMMLPYIDEP